MRTIGRTRLRCFAPACRVVGGKLRTIAASSRRCISSPSRTFGWRALPERFGRSEKSAAKHFDRLSKAGVFEAFFDTLASVWFPTADLIQMFDFTVVCVHVSAAGAKGGKTGQALGRSRGGFTTKIHAKSDASGDIIAFDLPPEVDPVSGTRG